MVFTGSVNGHPDFVCQGQDCLARICEPDCPEKVLDYQFDAPIDAVYACPSRYGLSLWQCVFPAVVAGRVCARVSPWVRR